MDFTQRKVWGKQISIGKNCLPIDFFHLLFRDKGMKHMVGKNWRDLFDMVIVQADKPNFFTDRRKYVSLQFIALLHPS